MARSLGMAMPPPGSLSKDQRTPQSCLVALALVFCCFGVVLTFLDTTCPGASNSQKPCAKGSNRTLTSHQTLKCKFNVRESLLLTLNLLFYPHSFPCSKRGRAHTDIFPSVIGEIKFQNAKYHSEKRNLILPQKASEPENRGKTQPAPGDGEVLLMDGKDRAKPNLAGAMWGGEGTQRRTPGHARACHCPDGDKPVEQGDHDEAPQKGRKTAKSPQKTTHHHPCAHAGGMTREREALAAPGKHSLLSTFIHHHPASPSPSSPAPPTATVAGRGLRAGAVLRPPHTHAPKRSLKRSNMD